MLAVCIRGSGEVPPPFCVQNHMTRVSFFSSLEEIVDCTLVMKDASQNIGYFVETGVDSFQPIVLSEWMILKDDVTHVVLRQLLDLLRQLPRRPVQPKKKVLAPKAPESNVRSIKLEGIIK